MHHIQDGGPTLNAVAKLRGTFVEVTAHFWSALSFGIIIEVLKPRKDHGIGEGYDGDSSGVLCSEALNCTCIFEKNGFTVKCTSAGDKLDKIGSELPQTTTHLILKNNGISSNLVSLMALSSFHDLQVLDLRDNLITSPGSVQETGVFGRISKVLLDNNPLECDCEVTPSLWTAEVTGACAYPPHLRGVEVNTLQTEDFKCTESCARLFTRGRRSTGFYNIAPQPRKQSYFRAWCDMHGPNGGWILLQQRINDSFSFYRNWASYENGFGKLGYGYWLGNSHIHAVTFKRMYVLRFEFPDHVDDQDQMMFIEYENFQVLGPLTDYTIQIGKHRGNMVNLFPDINNCAFSTWDRDNDKVPNRACAKRNKGAWWYARDCDVPDPNRIDLFIGITIMMKAKELLGGNCDSKKIPGRIECGWPNITKEQCLARGCCFNSTYDNNISKSKVNCFVEPHLVFVERIGCFSIESRRMLVSQDSPSEIIKNCNSLAWSRGLKYFAVHNGSECLVDKPLVPTLPRLIASKGCHGGRGGQDVCDVYRLTMFVTKPSGLRINTVTFQSVRVDWNPVPEPFILGYKILVQNIPLKELLPWNRTYAYIGGLLSNTTYIIGVSSFHGLTSEENPIENVESINITTKPALAPARAPDFITAYNKSSSSLVVMWSYLTEEHFQGQPIGYNITYYPIDSKIDTNFVIANKTINSTTLTNLDVHAVYVINVSAMSSGGIGPANTVKAQTGAEESAINFVRVNHTTNATTLINLTIYTTYTINVSAMSSGGIGPADTIKARTDAEDNIKYHPVDIEENEDLATVNFTTNTVALINLTVYTMYVINVSAVSSGGIGPASTVKGQTGSEAPSLPPDLIIAYAASPQSLVVKWRHMTEEQFHGQPIGYNISYYSVKLESDINFLTVNYTTSSTTLSNLTVYTMYVINVSAVSSGGIGPSNTVKARTDAEVPALAPDRIIAYNTSSTRLKVKWSNLVEESFQGQPIGYNIVYYQDDLESDVRSVLVNFTINTTTLSNLTIHTMYVIIVSAVSSGGIGPANTTKARTGAEAPSRSPDSVNAQNSSSMSLNVKWNRLPQEHFNGQPIGYNVIYYADNLESDIQTQSVKYTTNTTTLSNLTVYTIYVINVSAVSSGGVGPTKTVKARTGAEAPFRAPDSVTVRNSSSTSLVVEWTHLPEKDFQGQPIGYRITYFPAESENDINAVSVNFKTNSTTLINLTFYTVYAINVSVESSGGIGPANTAKARTDAAAPSRAPDSLAAHSASSTSLVIKWSYLPEEHFQGKPIGYIILYHKATSDIDKNVVRENFSANTTTLTNLTVYTMYVINVSAISSGGLGPANTVEARTVAEAPLLAPVLVTAHSSSSTSLVVKWARLREGDFRGLPMGYNIIHYPIEVERDIILVTVNYTTNATTLTNLTAYTMYVIDVSAVSSGGTGPVKTAKARTDAEVPSRAPEWVIAHNSSSTSLVVKWSYLEEKDFQGKLIGYNITYQLFDAESELYSLSVKYTTNTTNLVNLTVYTMYVISVSAVSSGGKGPANTVKARTDAEAPSKAPYLVTTYSSSSTSVVIRWSHLLERHFQGQPIGYRITCYWEESENDTKVVHLNYTKNTTTLKNLTVYTMYVINVSAVSSGGIGIAKTVKTRTDAEAPLRVPGMVIAHNTSTTSLIVKWSHLQRKDFQGKPVGYKISYRSLGPVSNINYVRVNYTTNTKTLANLTAYTMYAINVSAVSSGGVGPSNIANAPTEAGAPLRAPALVTAHNSSFTSLLIHWTQLPEEDFRGQPIGYNVIYYPAEEKSDINSVTVNYTTNTTTLTNLTVYTMYVINVSAVSSGGIGPAKTAKARTDAGAPSRAPDLVIAQNSSSTSLVVSWSHLPEEHFQGQPIGYIIACSTADLYNMINVVRENFTTNTTTLTNLTVYTTYVINVSAVSSGGIGPANTAKARTDASAPLRAPALVTAHNSSFTSLLIHWTQLPEEDFRGQPIGYNVIYYPAEEKSDINSVTVNYTTNTTTLTNLTVYTMYVINVSAVSSGGIGPAKTAKARTDAGAPSRAPDLVIAQNSSSTSLVVSWSHLPEEHFQGQPIGYIIACSTADLYNMINVVRENFTTNTTTLTNLTVYTTYVINVSAVSSGGIGPANTAKARTDASAPSLAPHIIVAHNTSSSSLLVEWSNLVEEQFQGQPFGYYIRYHPRLLGRKSEQFLRVNLQTNTTTLTNLAVYTMYVIFVSALSSGGMGPENMAEARTGIEAPFRAPALVIARNASSTNLVIKWSHLPEENFQGEPIGYLITHHPDDLESDLKSMFVNYTTNTTTLTNLTVYTMYVINVSAMSSGGTGPAKTVKTRTDAEAPSRAPDIGTAQNSSSTSLIVKWSHLAEKQFQGQPIGYNIGFYPLNLESELTVISLNCTTNTRTLTNLTVYTMYVINVSAVSSGGIGPANTVKAQTDAEVPFRGPYSVIAYNYSSTSLAVKWRHLLKEDFQGKPIGYIITYYPIDSENDIISLSVNHTTNIMTLTNLTVYTMYIINVSAVSSGGMGPANTAKGRTGAEVPSVAPSQVLVTAESSKSLHVSWTAVPPEYRHGNIHTHKIYVSLATQPSNYIATYFAFNPVKYNVTDLRVYTLYVIRVSAVNEAGEGSKSEAVTARTLESVPSAPPRNLGLVHRDSWFIVVEWKPVPEGYENGVIKGYRLLYSVKDSGNFVSVANESIYSKNTAVLSGLDFDTLYSIRVAAFTSVGSGNFSESIEVRTKMFDPCKEVFCSNGGTCILTPESYINASKPCICQKQFVGRFCDMYVAERSCRSPTVKLPSLSPKNITSFLIVLRANELVISSEVSLDCELSYETIFNWEVYDLHSKSREEPALSRYGGSSEFLIKRSKLRVGIYLVRLTVKMAGTQVFGFSEGYIRAVESPLVAHIAGGTKVKRGFNKTLVFNASLSRDPDSFQPPHGLRFTWVCRDSSQKYSDDLLEMPVALPSPSEASSDRGGCYGTGAGKIGGNDSIVRIESGYMTENSSYFITVVVDKHPKRAYFTQEVVISPGDPPKVEIRCEDSCDFRVNPSRRLALERLCEKADCERGLSYHWTLFEADAANGSKWIQVNDLEEKIRTRLTSPRIVTKLGVLEPNKIYKFMLTAKRRGGHSGYSEYKFATYSSPTEGKCDVTPLSGKTLETIFTFACSGWEDPDGLLQYSFVYFTDDDFTNVVYKGMKSSKRTKLPAGKKIKNFTIDFRVRVADMFGAFTEVRTPVQVLQLQIDAEKLVDRAVRLTTGNQSQLNNLIQSGDVSQAVQLAKAAIVAVDVDEKIPQDQLKEKRKTVKSSIVEQLSAVQVETVERIQQTSNVIAEAVSVVNEVTVEAQITAVDALQSMTKVLKEESLAGKNYEALLDGARSLAAGLGGMLKVSSYGAREYDAVDTHQLDSENLYNQRRNLRSLDPAVQPRSKRDSSAELLQAKNESKGRALGLLKSLDNVGRTILSRTIIGEMATELSSHSVSLLLFREEPNLFSGSILSNQGNSFTLPPDSNLFGNGTRFVDSQ
ncbi:Protein sidekick-1, partial [Stylophora pistillata]